MGMRIKKNRWRFIQANAFRFIFFFFLSFFFVVGEGGGRIVWYVGEGGLCVCVLSFSFHLIVVLKIRGRKAGNVLFNNALNTFYLRSSEFT